MVQRSKARLGHSWRFLPSLGCDKMLITPQTRENSHDAEDIVVAERGHAAPAATCQFCEVFVRVWAQYMDLVRVGNA